jgi:hypothetical protein
MKIVAGVAVVLCSRRMFGSYQPLTSPEWTCLSTYGVMSASKVRATIGG